MVGHSKMARLVKEAENRLEIHFQPLGGWSGDMFVAALLDAFPEFWPQVESAVASLKLGDDAQCRLAPHRDHILTGSRFLVAANAKAETRSRIAEPTHDHAHPHGPKGDHPDAATERDHVGHTKWADIRADLVRSSLDVEAKKHALAIFGLLAKAEAEVHGVDEALVAFHEVGAINSIVDIVAAAQLIALLGADRWTSAPLPIGSGRVRTAHGVMPLPAPATALLMRGLETIDDGVPGERVTPTGAAIARYLIDPRATSHERPRRLSRCGTGFGARTLPGLSNCLRALAFDEEAAQTPDLAGGQIGRRQLGVITFEIDDQSAEDLAAGLEHIRTLPDVLDVTQSSVLGKKGRLAAHVQVLVSPTGLESAIAACFEETTTIGLRYQLTEGAILRRDFDTIEIGGEKLRVKLVERPDGARSGKTEADDVARHRGHIARQRLRREAEAKALERTGPDKQGVAAGAEKGSR